MRYKALNIPQNGFHTDRQTDIHPGFQNTGLAIARPVLKSIGQTKKARKGMQGGKEDG